MPAPRQEEVISRRNHLPQRSHHRLRLAPLKLAFAVGIKIVPRERRVRPGVSQRLPRHIRAMRAHLHALHNVARPVLVAQVPVVSVKRRKQQLLGAGRQRLARRPTRLVERLPIPPPPSCAAPGNSQSSASTKVPHFQRKTPAHHQSPRQRPFAIRPSSGLC